MILIKISAAYEIGRQIAICMKAKGYKKFSHVFDKKSILVNLHFAKNVTLRDLNYGPKNLEC